jgi:hypothetical protein
MLHLRDQKGNANEKGKFFNFSLRNLPPIVNQEKIQCFITGYIESGKTRMRQA